MNEFPSRPAPVSMGQLIRLVAIAAVLVLCCFGGCGPGRDRSTYPPAAPATPIPELTGPPFLPTKSG